MTPVDRGLDVLTGPHRQMVLLALLFAIYGSTATLGPAVFNDVRATSAAAWNLAENGTLDFAEVGLPDVDWGVERPNGSVYTNRFPGAWLPAVPAYVLAPDSDEPVRSPMDVPIWPASLTAAALVAGAIVVLHEVMRDELAPRRALGVALVVGLGTPVWTIAADALWTHSAGVLVLALIMRAVQRERYLLAGAWLGYAITVRPTHTLTALGVGVALAVAHRDWRRLPQIGIPSVVGLAVLSLYSQTFFGTWLPVAGYDPGTVGAVIGTGEARLGRYSWLESLLGTFFDPSAGVFVYSAFLIVCVMFLVPGVRRSSLWARSVAIAGLLYWIGQFRGNRFTGGPGFFGYRLQIEPLWLSAVVLAHSWFAAMERRWSRLLGTILLSGALLLNIQFALR